MYNLYRLLKLYQSNETRMNITQEFYIKLFQIDHLLNYSRFFSIKLIFLKKSNTKILYIKVWFTDQTFKLCEIEDRES